MSEQSALERRPDNEAQQDRARSNAVYVPNVDVMETPGELILVADLPGSSSSNIDIRYEDGELTLNGKVGERNPGEARSLLREYGVGHFNRSFRIEEKIDAEKISAEYSRGVLTVHLPKVEAVKPRTIKVKARD
jgi:HSP20 family molecular chaperone IbpA